MTDNVAAIDLGTSNSKIAVFFEGKIQSVPNKIGDSSTPSIVAILNDGEAIGEETMLSKTDEKHTITQIKRLLGKNITDLKEFKDINYDIEENQDKLVIKVIRKGKVEYLTPEQIAAMIFKKLIKDASDFIGKEIKKAVFTIPANCDQEQRKAIMTAAEIAEIEVLEIINDPTAAALAYGLGTKENLKDSLFMSVIQEDQIKARKVLVFDLGGGTFDISILTIENNEYIVKITKGDPTLGGMDFDNKLVDYCLKDFCQKYENINENDVRKDSNAIRRLRSHCEKAKKKLSNFISTDIHINNFYGGKNLYLELTRDRFNGVCEELYQKIKDILGSILEESNYKNNEINDVILIGGSSKIPKIKEIVNEKFSSSKIRDKINQDEAVVTGAAWKAHKLNKTNMQLKVKEITSASYGVGMRSKNEEERKIGLVMSVLINKNSEVPARSSKKRYKTAKDNQTHFSINVFSGENKYVKDNKFLGEVRIDNLPPKQKGEVSFTIDFEVNTNGILVVNAEFGDNKISKQYEITTKKSEANPKTTVILRKNPESNKKLNEIKKIAININNKKEELKNESNDNNKINILKELCDYCTKIINIYEELNKGKDSETLYGKILDYNKYLINYYSKIIILYNEDSSGKEYINKIMDIIKKFINDDIETLLESLDDLKDKSPNSYIEIILNTVEILYEEGDKIVSEKKEFSCYYSRKLYRKANNIKNYIDEKLKEEINIELEKKLKDIEKKFCYKNNELEVYIKTFKDQIHNKNTMFLPNKTGNTIISNIINKKDDYLTIIDIFQELADSFSKEGDKETEAYIYANIIKINFKIFKNNDFELYDQLNRRINKLYEDLEDDDDNEDFEEPEWHKNLNEINKDIKEKRIEYEREEEEKRKKIYLPKKEEIMKIYKEKIEEGNKPKEFLEYLIDNYPYIKYDPSKKEELMKESFETLFYIIYPLYQPDSYEDKIYHDIYVLLGKIEEKYIKKDKINNSINDN